MQKRHLSGVLVNLLQNAREAMNGQGRNRRLRPLRRE